MNQTQERLLKIGEHLHIAEQHLRELIDHFQSAGIEFEASVNGENRYPYIPRMKADIDETLKEIAIYTSELGYAFEKPVIQAILKAYRCQPEPENQN